MSRSCATASLQQYDTPQNLFRNPANLFVAAFIGSPSMNLVDAQIDGDHVTFGNDRIPLPPGSKLRGSSQAVILGIRPTNYEHAATADPSLPRITVTPEVVEDLGAENHVLFSVDAPPVSAEAVRAASETVEDEGMLFADTGRAIFCACVDTRRPVTVGAPLELAVDSGLMHYFDPATGEALA